jgi:hypothetical protein
MSDNHASFDSFLYCRSSLLSEQFFFLFFSCSAFLATKHSILKLTPSSQASMTYATLTVLCSFEQSMLDGVAAAWEL